MSYRLTFRLLAALVLGSPALKAAAGDPALGERARKLRIEAHELRSAADRRRTEADAECRAKFLVSSCLEDVRREHIRSTEEARRIERQAVDIELELRREQETRDQAEREHRAAEKRDQAERGRAEHEATQRRAATTDASAVQRRAAGDSRAAAELRARQRRDADKARGRAQRVEQARARAAAAEQQRTELDRRKAEKAAKRAREAAKRPASRPSLPALPGG